jgi:hypothetical protein
MKNSSGSLQSLCIVLTARDPVSQALFYEWSLNYIEMYLRCVCDVNVLYIEIERSHVCPVLL